MILDHFNSFSFPDDGLQNLYLCDLAEWGVVIDHAEQVQKIKAQYWDPMWTTSRLKDDCDVQAVMDGLGIDRSALPTKTEMTLEQLEKIKEKIRATMNANEEDEDNGTRAKKRSQDDDDDDDDDDNKSEVSEAED